MSPVDRTYLTEPETRVTNEATGGQKGAKLTQLGALDPVSLMELARVAGMGAEKYDAYNFMKGTKWSLMYNAMMRHCMRFWAGEDIDPESGRQHMAHAAWMALALVGFALRSTGEDDRPPAIPEPEDQFIGGQRVMSIAKAMEMVGFDPVLSQNEIDRFMMSERLKFSLAQMGVTNPEADKLATLGPSDVGVDPHEPC